MAVVSRMYVSEIANTGYPGGVGLSRVKLQCQYVPDNDSEVSPEELAEIRTYWEASPGGSLDIQIRNEKAAEQFQVGDVWYLHLEKR